MSEVLIWGMVDLLSEFSSLPGCILSHKAKPKLRVNPVWINSPLYQF